MLSDYELVITKSHIILYFKKHSLIYKINKINKITINIKSMYEYIPNYISNVFKINYSLDINNFMDFYLYFSN